jgi:murein DD-endopeptidase MepM/ murein hydrolase activator NlpD
MKRPAPFGSLIARLLGLLSICFAVPAAAAEAITLAQPVKCELGIDCFVQNYVDHDTSSKVRDYQCGGRTYDGHDGTDIRVPNLEIQRAGVEVLAAGPGRVTGMRDGMDDISIRTIGKAAVAGKECGNGAVIDHGDGWSTQYCHMAKGSLRVKPGDRVVAGQAIGLVGLSGDTEFPHLHFTVRHAGQIVDPFAHEAPANSCGGGHSIWAAAIHEQTKYRPREILNAGFSGVAATMELIESGEVLKYPLSPASDALVAYVRTIGLQKGDQQILTIQDRSGAVISEYKAPALESDKAQYLISSGRKRKQLPWPPGLYRATYRVTQGDTELLHRTFEVDLGSK